MGEEPLETLYKEKIVVTPIWALVSSVRNRIRDLLAKKDEEVAMAVSFAASELIENAIKYGKPEIEIDCTLDYPDIILSVSNITENRTDQEELKKHIDTIRVAEDPFELYVQQLRKMMEHPDSNARTQVGLYKIVCEGKFTLDYTMTDDHVTVIARRNLSLHPAKPPEEGETAPS